MAGEENLKPKSEQSGRRRIGRSKRDDTMGYIMNVEEITGTEKKLNWYGSKLFGYFPCENLKSMDYLQLHGKLCHVTLWDYPFDNEMILSAGEFREFLDLYIIDFNREYSQFQKKRKVKCEMFEDLYEYDTLMEIYKSENDKKLWWD